MSDDHGDADFEASLANLDTGADGDGAGLEDVLEPAALDPADRGGMVTRLDSVQSTLSTLGMRIDALVTSTTSYRTALTDRLTEYSELVTKATRTQTADLDEYRRSAERAVHEVRESLVSTEDAVTRIGARLDELATGTDAESAESRRVITEIRSLLEAQERLADFLTESLDRFGAKVVEHIDRSHDTLAEQIALAVAAAEQAAAPSGDAAALAALVDKVDEVRSSLGGVGGQVGGLRADLRANLIDAVGELGVAEQHAAVERLLTELQETLLDVASGEVVGALWDEVRAMRAGVEAGTGADPVADAVLARIDALQATISALTADVRALTESEGEAAAPDTTGPRIDALQTSVATLADEVRTLASMAQPGETDAEPDTVGPRIDTLQDAMTALAAEVRTLLDEVEYEPAGAAPPVDEGAADAAGPAVRADQVAGLADEVAAVAEQLAGFRAELSTGLVVEPAVSLVDDIAGLRSAIDEVHARLDEGLVLADDDVAPTAAPTAPGVDSSSIAQLADQVASLRDLVSTRLQDVQTQLGAVTSAPGGATSDETVEFVVDVAPFEEAVNALRDEIRELASGSAPSAAGGMDDDVVDLLREEIRAAGGVSDSVMDALRDELKALRRRLAVKADEKVLDEAQLAQIADAVAARLAQD